LSTGESRLRHSENADLVDTPEPVLRGPQQSMIQRAVAFEVQDRVDDVLERLGAGNPAALRHVTDYDDRGARFLREAHEARGALADLSDVAWRALQIAGEHGLNGVDDHHRRCAIVGGGNDRLEQRLAQQLDLAGPVAQTIRAELHL
jgi:hypothetical protein